MADEKEIASAGRVYAALCRVLENKAWDYDSDEEIMTVSFELQSENVPIAFVIIVDVERQLLRIYSPLSVKFSQENRIDGSVAVCFASYALCSGSFDYDLFDGSIVFRMVTSFNGSLIGDALIEDMINCTCTVVEKYSEKFSDLENEKISIDDFIRTDE